VDDLRAQREREPAPDERRGDENGPGADGTGTELLGDVARISAREAPPPRRELRDARAELGGSRIEGALDRRVVEGGDRDADRLGAGRPRGEQRSRRGGDEG
jgi:hypothetical protein